MHAPCAKTIFKSSVLGFVGNVAGQGTVIAYSEVTNVGPSGRDGSSLLRSTTLGTEQTASPVPGKHYPKKINRKDSKLEI
jgi:hypothetical protein